MNDIKLFVRCGKGIAEHIDLRTVRRFRAMDEAIDPIPLRGPMAINHLRQGSAVYVSRTWRFYKEGRMTHPDESRHS